MIPRPPRSTLFPTRRSSDLADVVAAHAVQAVVLDEQLGLGDLLGVGLRPIGVGRGGDRKSTRLNSSHLGISYAVFCLKKKKEGRTHGFCQGAKQAGAVRQSA